MKLLLPWSLCRLGSTRNYSAEGIGKQVGSGLKVREWWTAGLEFGSRDRAG